MGNNITSSAGAGSISYNSATKEIDINLSDSGDFSSIQKTAHELKHAHQFLIGDLDLRVLGGGILYDQHDEREAFRRQNLFATPTSGSEVLDVSTLVSKQYNRIPRNSQTIDNNDTPSGQFKQWKELVKVGRGYVISNRAKSKL